MRSTFTMAFMCTLWLLVGAAPYAQAHGNFAGEKCDITRDSDPMKCMICVLLFEANPQHSAGLLEVGRVVMERVERSQYPGSICRVAVQSGQFALPNNRRLPNDTQVMDRVASAARSAIAAGGNGFLGFRSCRSGQNNVGENCFRVTGDAEGLVPDYLRVEQASWNTTSPAQAERIVDAVFYPTSVQSNDSGGSDAAL